MGHGGKVVSVPSNATDVIMSFGGNRLIRSTDDGATWSALANVDGVQSFALGMAQSGGYPTIMYCGTLSGVQGAYQSGDSGATWSALGATGQQPLASLDFMQGMAGEPNEYGRWYAIYAGSGAAYYTLS